MQCGNNQSKDKLSDTSDQHRCLKLVTTKLVPGNQLEATIAENAVVVKSLATPDGGKPGVLTEVSKRNAAILLTDGRAELAGRDEANEFREKTRRAKLAAEQAEAGRRLQISLVRPETLDRLTGSDRPSKE